MPTLARLVAAICLVLVGAAATQIIASNLPDPIPAKYLFPVNLGIAALAGWITIGKRLGRGIISSLNSGLTAGVVFVFWALLAHALGRMWILAFRETYKSPPDAILGVFEEFMNYIVYLQDFSVIGILVIGSALTGVIAEYVNKKISLRVDDGPFFYGTLRDETLLKIVLHDSSDELSIRPVELQDHAVFWADGHGFPMISESKGNTAKGLLVQGLTDDHIARLNFYEGGFDYELRDITVQIDGQGISCQVYWPEDPSLVAGKPWLLADWQREWGALSHEAAREAMGYYGSMTHEELQWQFPRIRARADSRLRAERQPAPTTVRSGMTMQDVSTEKHEASHRGFYALDTLYLRHKKFDGTTSELLRREVFKSSDATIVLPYDPVTDQILMVEQFRMGPTGRADPVPWCLEPVAGLIDPGEDPEETAHREAWEEAGVKFSSLETVANGYSSPGASTGYFFLFVGLCDLSDHNSDQSGILDEGEDIRSHIIGFEHAMELVDTGEINVLPTILCLNWLARHRSRLRGVA